MDERNLSDTLRYLKVNWKKTQYYNTFDFMHIFAPAFLTEEVIKLLNVYRKSKLYSPEGFYLLYIFAYVYRNTSFLEEKLPSMLEEAKADKPLTNAANFIEAIRQLPSLTEIQAQIMWKDLFQEAVEYRNKMELICERFEKGLHIHKMNRIFSRIYDNMPRRGKTALLLNEADKWIRAEKEKKDEAHKSNNSIATPKAFIRKYYRWKTSLEAGNESLSTWPTYDFLQFYANLHVFYDEYEAKSLHDGWHKAILKENEDIYIRRIKKELVYTGKAKERQTNQIKKQYEKYREKIYEISCKERSERTEKEKRILLDDAKKCRAFANLQCIDAIKECAQGERFSELYSRQAAILRDKEYCNKRKWQAYGFEDLPVEEYQNHKKLRTQDVYLSFIHGAIPPQTQVGALYFDYDVNSDDWEKAFGELENYSFDVPEVFILHIENKSQKIQNVKVPLTPKNYEILMRHANLLPNLLKIEFVDVKWKKNAKSLKEYVKLDLIVRKKLEIR